MTQNFYNAAYDKVTIFTPEGEPHECNRLNARELVNTLGFKWNKGSEAPATAAVEEPEPATSAQAVAEIVDPDPELKVDLINAPLSEIAETVAGDADIEKYLAGFTADALRAMAEERYGEKISSRTGKDKAIEKIVAFESQKLETELDQ